MFFCIQFWGFTCQLLLESVPQASSYTAQLIKAVVTCSTSFEVPAASVFHGDGFAHEEAIQGVQGN